MKTISVVENFTEYPGLRHCNISERSGEEFYHTVLNAAFAEAYISNEELQVNLDFTAGYASSFLDEAFGNLVYDFTLDHVKRLIIIVSEQEPHWKKMIESETFNQWEKRRKEDLAPKKTKLHDPWYRLNDGKLQEEVWVNTMEN